MIKFGIRAILQIKAMLSVQQVILMDGKLFCRRATDIHLFRLLICPQKSTSVPQSSVLDPFLILVYINDIVKNNNNNIHLFTDDPSVLVIAENDI